MLPMQKQQLAFGKSSSDSRNGDCNSLSSILVDKAAISLFSKEDPGENRTLNNFQKKEQMNKSSLFTNSGTISLVNKNTSYH